MSTAATTSTDQLTLEDAVAYIESEGGFHFAHSATTRLRVLKQIVRGEFPPPVEAELPRTGDDADDEIDWAACHWTREDLAEWLAMAETDTPDAATARAERWAKAHPKMTEAAWSSLASYAAREEIRGEGEWRYWHDRYHAAAFLDDLLLFLVVSGGLVWLLLGLLPPIPAVDSVISRGALVGLLLGLYGLVTAYRFVMRVLVLDYTLTEERLLAHDGLFARIEREARILLMRDISAHAGPIQRLLGLGTVMVHCDDHDTPHLALRGIKDPFRIKELIWQASETDKIEKRYFLETTYKPTP